MSRTKEHARKSTGNGGHKRKRGQAQSQQVTRKKAKTQEAASDAEDPDGNSESGEPTLQDKPDQEELAERDVKKQPKSRQGRRQQHDAEESTSRPKQVQYDQSVAARDPALLSDLFAQNIRKYFKNVTSLELTDMNLPSSAFKDTTRFTGPHTEAHLSDFLKTHVDDKDSLSTCNGTASPHTAIVVSSGMRVADLYRTLLVFNNDRSKVGKLITKHMKLGEMVKYLQETKVGIIVTTPKRLRDLIQEKAVDTDSLRRIVIDGSFQNDKQQTLFDMKDTFQQTVELMNLGNLRSKLGVGEGQIEVMVF